VIYAVSNGLIDTVPVARIREWERGFIEFVGAQFPQIGDSIRTSRALSKENEAELRRAVEQYSKQFAA
jgi:F-type H+-transporting ATPase subunit alpha